MSKVLIIHYRIGKTDGVSLEISNWKQILERSGWKVETCSGMINVGADYVIEHLEPQENQKVYDLDEESFGGFKKYTKEDFESEYKRIRESLLRDFGEVLFRSKPDRVIVSNIFSVGENLPAASALLSVLKKFEIPTIAVHHDFWWENSRYDKPSCDVVSNDLDTVLPPKESFIKHVVINEIAKTALAKRKQIFATILHDCIDFRAKSNDEGGACRKLLSSFGVGEDDLVILQGTRIVHRKNIETAMDFANLLSRSLPIDGKKRLVFVMAGYAEKRDEWYQKALRKYATRLGIRMIEMNGLANSYSSQETNTCKLLDVYPYADLVTYPSVYEGFGNQFLEAIFAKKPLVMFEYPVYKTDIGALGFEIISLGDRVNYDGKTKLARIPPQALGDAVSRTVELLNDSKKRKIMVDNNFSIGEREFSFEKTSQVWQKLLKSGTFGG